MFTAALFIIANTWKQSQCLWTEDRIKRMWCVHACVCVCVCVHTLCRWTKDRIKRMWGVYARACAHAHVRLVSKSCWLFATPRTVAHQAALSMGILQARILEWVSMPSPNQGSNPGLPHCRQILHWLSHQGNPRILEWVAYPFSRGTSHPRKANWGFLLCKRILYQLNHQVSPMWYIHTINRMK